MLLNKEILIGIYNYVPLGVFIWTGLGSDNNWSTSQNWNIRVPQAYDILRFAGTTRLAPFNNLTVDTPYNGIEFISGAGAFTLNGNRFVLNSGSVSNSSINTQTINNDIVLGTDAGTINCATSAINLNGNISGSGTLTKTGSATLTLSGNNSYTGNTTILSGILVAASNNALGSTGVISVSSNGQLRLNSSNIVINNPIQITSRGGFGQNDINNGAINSTAGNNTINGPISAFGGQSVFGTWIRINNGTLTIRGGLSASGTDIVQLTNSLSNNAQIFISQTPLNIDGVLYCFSQGSNRPVVFNVANNTIGELINYYSGRVTLNVPNAFGVHPSNTMLRIGNNDDGTLSILELSGNNLNTGRIATTQANATNAVIVNNSTTNCDFTINQTINSTFTGTISGNINLIKQGSFTLTLSAGTNLSVKSLGPRYTGFTAISAGALINYALSSNPSNKVNFAEFTNTALTVNFRTPPTVGDSFILLPARTVNLYPSVTLQNASGRTASYNSTTSTLSINT